MGSRASGGMRGVGGAALDTSASIICRRFCLRGSSRSRNQTRKEPDLLPPQVESEGQREGADVRCDSAGGGQPVREPRESDEMRFGHQAGAAPEEQKCARCVVRELARQKEAEYNQPGGRQGTGPPWRCMDQAWHGGMAQQPVLITIYCFLSLAVA